MYGYGYVYVVRVSRINYAYATPYVDQNNHACSFLGLEPHESRVVLNPFDRFLEACLDMLTTPLDACRPDCTTRPHPILSEFLYVWARHRVDLSTRRCMLHYILPSCVVCTASEGR